MKSARGYAAMDCEMVETVGCENALARVSIVDEQSNVLLDQIVIPPGGDIVTYRSRSDHLFIIFHSLLFSKA